MNRILFLLILIAVLLSTGCASFARQTAAATPGLPELTDEWTIKMIHSGGIMGLMRSVEVSSDGSYTAIDERGNKTVTGDLSKNELAKLTGIMTRMKFTAAEIHEGVCADCFIYDIEIISNGEKFNIQLDDMTLAESGMEELVSSLRTLMDTALK